MQLLSIHVFGRELADLSLLDPLGERIVSALVRRKLILTNTIVFLRVALGFDLQRRSHMLTILLLELFISQDRREVQPALLSGHGDLGVLAGPVDPTTAISVELLILFSDLLNQILPHLLVRLFGEHS